MTRGRRKPDSLSLSFVPSTHYGTQNESKKVNRHKFRTRITICSHVAMHVTYIASSMTTTVILTAIITPRVKKSNHHKNATG